MTCPICPHCGYDLAVAAEAADGPFAYHPQNGFTVNGERLRFSPQVHELLGALLRDRGTTLSRHVLADRLGYEGDHPDNIIAVHLCRARAAIERTGEAFPIETVWGVGVQWRRKAGIGRANHHLSEGIAA